MSYFSRRRGEGDKKALFNWIDQEDLFKYTRSRLVKHVLFGGPTLKGRMSLTDGALALRCQFVSLTFCCFWILKQWQGVSAQPQGCSFKQSSGSPEGRWVKQSLFAVGTETGNS